MADTATPVWEDTTDVPQFEDTHPVINLKPSPYDQTVPGPFGERLKPESGMESGTEMTAAVGEAMARDPLGTLFTPAIPIPKIQGRTTLGKLAAAPVNVASGLVESAESLGGLLTLPLGGPVVKGLFGGLAAKSAGEQLGQASVTHDVQQAAEGVLAAGLAPWIALHGTMPERPTLLPRGRLAALAAVLEERAKPIEEGVPKDATQERQVQEGIQPERERVDAQRLPAEAGPRDQLQSAAEVQAPVQAGPPGLLLTPEEQAAERAALDKELGQEPTKPASPAAPVETPEEVKERTIKERIAAGIKDENLRLSVTPDQVLTHPKTGETSTIPGTVQVDEIHPTLGNTFSSNPAQLKKLGLDIPDQADLVKLPLGRYTLPEARAKIAEIKKPAAAPAPAETPAVAASKIEIALQPGRITTEEVPRTNKGAKQARTILIRELKKLGAEAPKESEIHAIDNPVENITIDIPGDGEFTVVKTKENLEYLLKRAKRISTTTKAKASIPGGAAGISDKNLTQFTFESASEEPGPAAPAPGRKTETGPATPKTLSAEHINWDEKVHAWEPAAKDAAGLEKQVRAQELGRAGAASNATQTRRIFVVQGKDGKVHAVSGYVGKTGLMLVDPASKRLIRPHVKAAVLLTDYQPLFTGLLKEPVKNFSKTYASLNEFNKAFGNDAQERLEAMARTPTPPEHTTSFERDEEGRLVVHHEPLVEPPKPAPEAAAVLNHMRHHPDVDSAVEAVKTSPDKEEIIDFLAQEVTKLKAQNPQLSDEQAIAQTFARFFSEAKSQPAQAQRGVPALGKRGPEALPAQAGPQIGPGPGAQTAGTDLPPPAQQAIAESLKTLPTRSTLRDTFQAAERIAELASVGKEAWQRALARARGAGVMMRDLLLGRTQLDTFDNLAYQHEAMKQRGTANARTVRREGLKRFKNEDEREAMNNWLSAQAFPSPDATLHEWAQAAAEKASTATGLIERARWTKIARRYQQALALTPDQVTAARQVEQAYRAMGEELARDGVLHNVLEDYMGPHLVESASTDPALNTFRADLSAGRLSTNFRYAMKRMFETEFALEMAGKKLKTKDIFGKLTTYLEQSEHIKANRWMVKQLKDGETATGEPWVDFRATKTLPEPRPGEAPAVLVKPSKNPGNPGEYVRVDHPALRGWRWVAKDDQGRSVLVEGDAWVHRDIYPKLRNILKRSSLYNLPGLETITSAQQNLKGMKFSGSLFHPLQLATHMAFHLSLPVKLAPVDVNSPHVMDAMNHGLKMFEHEGLEGFSAGIASTRWVNKLPIYGRIARRLGELTFEDFLPAGKMTLYDNILSRNQQRYSADPQGFRGELTEWMRKAPGLRRLHPELSPDDIKTLSAVQANFAMGGQPWKAMAMNPEFTHALHLAFRAPDFLASRLGFIARAGTKLGAEERMALLVGTVALYSTARMFNMALSDDHQPHLDDPFAVFVGNRRYSIRTVMADAVGMMKNPVQWWRNRLAPLVSSPIEFFSGVNWMGKPVSKVQALKDAAWEAAPIPFTARSDVKWWEQLQDAMGVHVSRHSQASEGLKILHDWMDKNAPKQAPMLLPPSKYIPLRQALSDEDTAAAKAALADLRKTGEKDWQIQRALEPWHPLTRTYALERQFEKALTPEQKIAVDKLKAEKKAIYERLNKVLKGAP